MFAEVHTHLVLVPATLHSYAVGVTQPTCSSVFGMWIKLQHRVSP